MPVITEGAGEDGSAAGSAAAPRAVVKLKLGRKLATLESHIANDNSNYYYNYYNNCKRSMFWGQSQTTREPQSPERRVPGGAPPGCRQLSTRTRASLLCGEVPGGAGWGLVLSRQHSQGGRRRQDPRRRWTESRKGFGKAGCGEAAEKGSALVMTSWGDREGKPQNPPDLGPQLTCVGGEVG